MGHTPRNRDKDRAGKGMGIGIGKGTGRGRAEVESSRLHAGSEDTGRRTVGYPEHL